MHNHWTEEEHNALEVAESMDALADIALTILSRMKEHNKSIIQVCGPMTTGGFGKMVHNMELFEHVVANAEKDGYFVFNQLPFQDAMIRIIDFKENFSVYPMEILDVFYGKIFHSGYLSGVLFMPDYKQFKGYTSSVGAVWEYERGKRLGMTVEMCPEVWLQDFKLFKEIDIH